MRSERRQPSRANYADVNTSEEHHIETTDFQGATVPVIEALVRENRTIYRPDTLVPGEFEEGFGPEGTMKRRSVVDIPFAGGTVAMSSPKPDAFFEQDIETLEMIANVISEGYTKYIDLTERKRMEEELRKYHEHLEELVEKRTAELKITNEQLQREITERKQTEEELKNSEERLKKILFEYAPEAYYLNDLKGNFVDGNKVAEEISGYKKEELIGKIFFKLKLLPPWQIPKAAALLAQNVLGRRTGPDELILNRRDGSQVVLEINTFPVKIQNQTLVLGIGRDITERKRTEVKKHRDHLEELVEERTTESKRMQEVLIKGIAQRERGAS